MTVFIQFRVRIGIHCTQIVSEIYMYDITRLTILTCAQKLTSSQLNLPHGTEQKRIMKKLKPKKTEMLLNGCGYTVPGTH